MEIQFVMKLAVRFLLAWTFVVGLSSTQLFAQSPADAYLGGQTDVKVHLYLFGRNTSTDIKTYYRLYLDDELFKDFYVASHSTPMTDSTVISLVPGVKYKFKTQVVHAIGWQVARVIGFNPPPGYRVFIDQKETPYINDTGKNHLITYDLEIRQDDESMGGVFMPAASASDLKVADLLWEAGLGHLQNGSSAGRFQISAKEITPDQFHRDALEYVAPFAAGESESDEVHIVRNLSGIIEQVRAPQCLVDIQDIGGPANGYTVTYYSPTSASPVDGIYSTNGLTTLAVYSVEPNGNNGMKVIRTIPGQSSQLRTSIATYNPQSKAWTISTTQDGATKTASVVNTQQGADKRIETTSVSTSGGSGLQNFTVKRTYETIEDLGEVLVREEVSPVSGSSTREWVYYTDPEKAYRFGRIKGMTDDYGRWTFYDYLDPENDIPYEVGNNNVWQYYAANRGQFIYQLTAMSGQIKRIFRSYTDAETPALSVDVESLEGNANFYRTDMEWEPGRDFYTPRMRRSTTYVGSKKVGESENKAFVFPLNVGDYTDSDWIEVSRKELVANNADSPNEQRAVVSARYVPNEFNPGMDHRLNFKPYFQVMPDLTKVSYGYADVGGDWYEVSVTGQAPSVLKAVDDDDNKFRFNLKTESERQAFWLSWGNQLRHGNMPISVPSGPAVSVDKVNLVDGKSMMSVRKINAMGRVVMTQNYAYIGASWMLTATRSYGYTAYSQVNDINMVEGGQSRPAYDAVWEGLRLKSMTDEQGLTTNYGYGGYGRIIGMTVEGSVAQGIPELITTTYEYDILDRVISQTVTGEGKSLTLSQEMLTDGLVTKSTDTDGLVTTYSYAPAANAGMTSTVTLPGGFTVTKVVHKDGRPKSSSGTAVIPSKVIYDYDALGQMVREIKQGPEGGPYQKSTTDWLGRLVEVEVPSPVQGQPFKKTYQYNSITAQLTSVLESEVAPGQLSGGLGRRQLFYYDEMGELTKSGLDVNNSGSLEPGSVDRFQEVDTKFISESGLWVRSESKVFPTGSGISLGETKAKISGFDWSDPTEYELSQVLETDLHGNTTIGTVTLNRNTSTITTEIDLPDSETNAILTNINGFLSSTISPEGHGSTMTYNGLGLPLTSTGSRGITTEQEYYPNSARLKSVTQAGQYTINYAYEQTTGRLSSVTDLLGRKSYVSYNDRGQMFKRWGEAIRPIAVEYDEWGRPTAMKTYRQASGSAFPTSDASTTTYAYDNESGVLLSKSDEAGNKVFYSYDQLGRVVVKTAGRGVGVETRYGYDPKTDELLTVTHLDGTPNLKYRYSNLGELLEVTETGPDGVQTWDFNYDHEGATDGTLFQLTEVGLPENYFPGVSKLNYTYQDGAGVAGRLAAVGYGDTAPQDAYKQAFSYGVKGRLTGLTLDPKLTGLSPLSVSLAYENKNGGLVKSNMLTQVQATLSGGDWTQTRTYDDDRGLLENLSYSMDSTAVAGFAYTHDHLGRRTSLKQTGTVFAPYSNATDGLYSRWGYTPRSELSSVLTRLGNVSGEDKESLLKGRSFSYAYDAMGNRTSKNVTGVESIGSTANSLNQLVSLTNKSAIDVFGLAKQDATVTVGVGKELDGGAAGVIAPAEREGAWFHRSIPVANESSPVWYGDGGEDKISVFGTKQGTGMDNDVLTWIQRTAYAPPKLESLTYDEDGNLKTSSRWTYSWDAENRLVSMETSAAAVTAGVPKERLIFGYDYQSRRDVKDRYTWDAVGSEWELAERTRFLYQGMLLVLERVEDGNGTLVCERRYFWGPDLSGSLGGAGGIGGLYKIVHTNAGGTHTEMYASSDGSGNVIALSDASGEVKARYEYGPFGEPLQATGEWASLNPVRFSSKYHDAETGLVYYGYRFYAPSLGRFLNRDPIGEEGGLNLYALATNDPVNGVDPYGLNPYTFSYSLDSGFGTGGGGSDIPVEFFGSGGGFPSFDFGSSFGGFSVDFGGLGGDILGGVGDILGGGGDIIGDIFDGIFGGGGDIFGDIFGGGGNSGPSPAQIAQMRAKQIEKFSSDTAKAAAGASNQGGGGGGSWGDWFSNQWNAVGDYTSTTLQQSWRGASRLLSGDVSFQEFGGAALKGGVGLDVQSVKRGALRWWSNDYTWSEFNDAYIEGAGTALLMFTPGRALKLRSARLADYTPAPRTIATSGGSGFGARIPYGDLSAAIKRIHVQLPEPGSFAVLPRNAVSMRQLRTLTRHTGDEYSLFTKGNQRLIIRGQNDVVNVSPQMYDDILAGKYGRFSGHTHPPGHSLQPGPGDQPFLRALGQRQSGIWGDDGVNLFDQGFPWNIGN